MSLKIGVAISVYNKGAFVATNLNVFKSVWKDVDPYVAVSCNDPETFKKLSMLKIDKLVEGLDITVNSKHDLRRRQYDTIKKSVTAAAENSDYVIHWHGDAFALDPKAIIKLIEHMKENNFLFAGRGFWKKHTNPKIPDGDIDDHFFILNSKHVRESGLYDDEEQVEYVARLAQLGICSEGILSHLVQKSVPEENVFIYSDMSECEVLPSSRIDPRYPDNVPRRTLPPVNLDPIRKFLHCDDMNHLERIFGELNIDTSLIVRQL